MKTTIERKADSTPTWNWWSKLALGLAAAGASLLVGEPNHHGLVRAAAAQETGMILDGFITDAAFRQMKAGGHLANPAKGEGFVYVEVSPASAQVTVANRRGDNPPFTLEKIPTGYQPVSIRAPGYDNIDGFVLVEPLKVARVRIVLPPKEGDLTILSEPPGARVLIDGQSVGVAPITIEKLAGGDHQVLLTADGGLMWQGTVTISGGVELLRPRLAPGAQQALAAGAPVLPASLPTPAPVAPTPAAPFVPVPAPAPAWAAAPATPPAPVAPPASSGEIDLSGLSPALRSTAWSQLTGKRVEITLGTGQTAMVEVGGVRGDAVILNEVGGGSGRLVPMSHISKVRKQ